MLPRLTIPAGVLPAGLDDEKLRTPGRGKERMMDATIGKVEFDGETLKVGNCANPVWVKIGGLTLQITETENGAIVDAWRKDDEPMTEPWTVEFDGKALCVR